ncbi:hypothetical protein BGW39_008195 [Mortierella sp. 14UC]|nr:hypothetical protein BGW39_008195 [Mortierella sp. 14UC]
MWNDPDLNSSRGHASSGAPLNYRDRKANAKKDELSAFGYEALFFQADSMAEAIEQGQWLITWQGEDPSSEYALRLDRYDVRNLLDDQRLFIGPREIHHDNFLSDPSEFDEERFEDLDSDEELLFDMDEDERKDYLDRKQERREGSSYKGVHYDYDGNQDEQVQEPAFYLHFDVPEGMATPESEKTLALIERTAKFVNSSSEPTMEIILQAKQATNPNFAFMSKRHHLFQFYKHVRWLMQTGLYEYAEEVRQREVEEARAEQEELVRKAAALAERERRLLHVDLDKVIEKTIEFLKAHQLDPVYEKKLLSITDARFEFMRPGHMWHDYYTTRRREIFHSQEEHSRLSGNLHVEAAQATAHMEMEPLESAMEITRGTIAGNTLETTSAALGSENDSTSLQAVRVQQLNTSSNDSNSRGSSSSRADEMRRLDRLQRIKDLFKQKQRKDSGEAAIMVGQQQQQQAQEQEQQDAAADVAMAEFDNVAGDGGGACPSRPTRSRSRSRAGSRSPPRSRSHSPDSSLRKRTRLQSDE